MLAPRKAGVLHEDLLGHDSGHRRGWRRRARHRGGTHHERTISRVLIKQTLFSVCVDVSLRPRRERGAACQTACQCQVVCKWTRSLQVPESQQGWARTVTKHFETRAGPRRWQLAAAPLFCYIQSRTTLRKA